MRTWESSERKRPSNRKPARNTGRRSISSGGSIRDYPFLRTFYQHQSVISDNIVRFIFFLVIATLLYAFVIGEAGAIRLLSLKKTHTELETEVAMHPNRMSAAVDLIRRNRRSVVDRWRIGLFRKSH